MTYLESVQILTGWYGGVISSTTMTAAILPIWFDWASPGIQRALFLRLSWVNQTPLLQHAFILPLFIQALSVYTIISSQHGIGPQCLYLWVIWVGFLFGSMNIQKPSARLTLQVIDGSKVIFPLVCLASSFLSFCDVVRDILSDGSCFVRLCFGGMRFSLVWALSVHLCRFLQPMTLSLIHLRHI